MGLLISPKFPQHLIVAQHFPSSLQTEFPISLPLNSSSQKAATSLPHFASDAASMRTPGQVTSIVSIAVSLSHQPEWSPGALLSFLTDTPLPGVLYSLGFPYSCYPVPLQSR